MFQKKAISLVYQYIQARLEKTDTHVTFSEDEVYIDAYKKFDNICIVD